MKPGDTGQIQFQVQHETESGGDIEGLTVSVNAPAHFIVKGTSILGPLTATPGETKTFAIDYEIAAGTPQNPTPEGQFTVGLHAVSSTEDMDPEALDTQVKFSVIGASPLVTWDLHRSPLPPKREKFQGVDLDARTTVADDAFVSVSAAAGLVDFRIQKDGETIHHFSAFSATGATSIYGPLSVRDFFTPAPAKLPDGEYVFTAVDARNRETLGKLRRFTFDLSVSTPLSKATYDEGARKFISRVALEARSNSGSGVREVEVYPVRRDLSSDELIYLPKVAGAVFNGEAYRLFNAAGLASGDYAAFLYDDLRNVIEKDFTLFTALEGGLFVDFLSSPTSSQNAVRIGSGAAGAFSLAINQSSGNLFEPSGSVTSQLFDLKTLLDPGVGSSSPTVKVSTSAIGLALYSPIVTDFGFRVSSTTSVTPTREPPSTDTGMTMTFEVRSGQTSEEAAAGIFRPILSQKSFTRAAPGPPYIFENTRIEPLAIERFVQYRVNMTRSAVPLFLEGITDVPAGGQSPTVYDSHWNVSTAMVEELRQGPGGTFRVASQENVDGSPALVLRFAATTRPITPITVKKEQTSSYPTLLQYPGLQDFGALSDLFNIDPDTITFEGGGVLTMKIRPQDAAAAGIDPQTLSIWRAEPGDQFKPLTVSVLDLAGGKIEARIEHLQLTSLYMVFGRKVAPPGGGGGGGGGEPAPGRGLAISADSQGGLWMVLQDTSSVISLAKFNSSGVFEGGIPLPGAGDFGAWRIGFDEQGNAVAAGSSSGETTGPDVAIYRVSPEGTLLSTAAFDAGLGGADIAMDASGDLWIAGAVQTGGQSEVDLQAQLALWKYAPETGLRLKSLYAGPGGLDAGFGVRTDSSGNIWIVGFSSNPATPGPNKLDLALWKYEATGSSLTAGPFRKSGYARGIGETTNAKLSIFNGSIFLSAGKLNETGDMTLATAKHDLSGAEIWSRSWNSNPVADDVPSAILTSAQGLSVAGGVFRGQDRPLAVWKYSLDGTLFSAETSSGIGKANDAAANSEGTWLAVEGRVAPFKFTGGTALPGSGDGQAPQDTLPPRTTLVVGEPKSGADPIVISTFTNLSFTAIDDLSAVGDGLGSGVRETLYLVDIDPQSCDGIVQVSTAPRGTCANPVYGSTFTLTAGTHTIAYLSRDNAGNEEAPQQKNFSVNLVFAAPGDMLAPRTTLAVGTPKFGTEPVFVATRTPLGFDAVDDLAAVGDGAGTVARTYYSVDGSSFGVFTASFSLAAEGPRLVRFYSVDASSNSEVVKLSTLTVDATPPVTSALVNGQAATSEILISTDSISFTATDTVSGVKMTFHALDFGEPSSSTSPFTMSPGTHTLQYMSVDNLENEETIQAVALTVLAPDASAPSLALTPPNGSTVTTARPLIRADYSDAGRGIDAASVRLELDGVDITTQAAVTSSSAAYSSGTDLAQGTHALMARVLDLAGNAASASSKFFIDSIAPVSTLLKNGHPSAGAALVAISTDSFGFAASDAGTGVAEIRFTLDAGTEQVYASTFTLSAGTRELRYFAVDRAGNRETERTVTVEVSGPDAQGPSLTFSLTAGATITATAPLLSVFYFDAAGVDAATVRFFLDGVDVTTQAAVTASSASFTPSGALSQGAHEVTVSARDFNGNLAQANILFYIDSIAPATQLLGLGTSTVHGALLVTQAGSSLTLIAQDPVVNGFATGVVATYYLVDFKPQDCPGGSIAACPGSTFTSPFALANGTHTVYYASKDAAGNLESVKTAAAATDGAGPALLIQSPLAGEVYRALASTVAVRFAVTDDFDPAPVFAAVLVQLEDRGTPRGVRPAVVAVAQGDDLAPQSLDDGLWQLRVSATDFVLNSRTAASGALEIIHDVLPPRTSLLIGEPKDGTAPVFVATGTRLGLAAVDDLLLVGDAAGLGVERTFYSVDGGSFAVFSASFTLASEGPRLVSYFSVDRSSNTEAVRTSAVTLDATAPVTAVRVNGQAVSAGTLILVTTDAVSLAATDAGAGVRETRYALDGGPELVSPAPFTLAAGTHTLTFFSVDRVSNREAEKMAALTVLGLDTAAPTTELEIGQPKFGTGPVFVSSSTRFGLTSSEPGRIYYSIAGGAFQVFAGSFTIAGEGVRTLSWYGEDLAGNRESTKTATVYADPTAPVTTLSANGTSVVGGSLNMVPGDVLALSSTDPASGVRETRFSLDGGGFLVYTATFTLAAGPHTLKFRGLDNVLNQEQERTVSILVASPGGDTTPPSLSLACPGAEGGICSVFKESVFVRGGVFDAALAWYRLEAGGVLISSGTANKDGVLGVWDVSGVAGAQTLILTGEDLAGNTATLTRQVFVGEPARLLVFGGKKEMGRPQGVAVDNSRGIVYVANTNKGEIRLYSLGGEFIKAYPDYRHPRAVAVDEGGNLYMAESGKDRIVKLGPLGNPLWTKGRSGRGPLEFRDPSGIAAKGGKVAISDTRNRRVQVLDQDGNFLNEFPIPEGTETLVADDGDEDDEPENHKGVPVGIALDDLGRIYVADAKNKKGLAYDAQGVLIREFGGPGVFKRPEGISVSTSGECVFISDRIRDRITKFDGEGRIVLNFGTQGNIFGKRTVPVETVFRRPIGLHLDTAGTLWVADRNNEVIQRFGLPGALTAGSPAGGGFRVTDEEQSPENENQAAAATEELYLREAYAIPNPCKGCGSQGFVVQVGLADSVSLECRNVMGRVIYQNAFPSPTLKDTGNGRGPQYTYEQNWPLSGIGTGIYACTMTARKAGKGEIRKIIRSAVLK